MSDAIKVAPPEPAATVPGKKTESKGLYFIGMALTHTYDKDAFRVSIKGTGLVSLDDRYACIREIMNDRAVSIPSTVLIDVSEIEEPPTDSEVHRIALLLTLFQDHVRGRLALLSSKGGPTAAMAFIAAFSDPPGQAIKAFFDRVEAERWLSEQA